MKKVETQTNPLRRELASHLDEMWARGWELAQAIRLNTNSDRVVVLWEKVT